MIVRCTICVALCATLFAEVGFTQASPPRSQGPRPTTRQRQTAPPPVSPELEKVLREWEVASGKIQRLQGKHKRRVYDLVFKVEKLSFGHFYHEVPDKGRIDIEPADVPKGTKSTRMDDATGKAFALIGDLQEKWVCDGKRIVEINEKEKTATFLPIPPRGQGDNIMNSPLPFLFGMKAERAKERYQLSLISNKVNLKTRRREIQIQAFPRWQSDGSNWKEARIILDHPTYLPLHIKLVGPTGEKETVFSFSQLQVNKFQLLPKWIGDPFRPSLRGYTIDTTVPGKTPDKPTITVKEGEQIVPDVSTWPIADAKRRLSQAGFQIAPAYVRGGAAPTEKLIHKVRTTVPEPMTPVKKGSTIKLVVFERPAARK